MSAPITTDLSAHSLVVDGSISLDFGMKKTERERKRKRTIRCYFKMFVYFVLFLFEIYFQECEGSLNMGLYCGHARQPSSLDSFIGLSDLFLPSSSGYFHRLFHTLFYCLFVGTLSVLGAILQRAPPAVYHHKLLIVLRPPTIFISSKFSKLMEGE